MKTKLLSTLLVTVLFFVPFVSFGQAPNLGVTSSFALFTGTGAFDNTGASYITGDIGSNVSPITGFPDPGTVVGQIHSIDAVSAQGSIDVNVAYGDLSAISVFTVIGTTLGNGQVLSPGVYSTGGASTLNGNLTLDAGGNANALFIIKIGGALSTSTFSNVLLIGSASLCNVYWQVEGEFDLGESSVFRGTVIADGAISLLEGSSLFGRGLSRAGAISLHNNVVNAAMKPTASVITEGGAIALCAGGSVVLSGNVGGTWSTGATTPSITVTTAGNYYVTNTNACGSVTSNHIAVTVSQPVVASVITAGGATTFCAGGSVVLSGNVGGVWSTGAKTATITVTKAGDYYVTNTNGCGTVTSNHIAVTVNSLAVASVITAGGKIALCVGENVVLSGNVGGTWSNGATTATITVNTAGDYYVTNTNGCGSVTSNHIAVTITSAVVASVITAGGATTFCEGGQVVLSGNVGGTWSNGTTTATLTVKAAGDYYVTNTNACGTVTSNHIVVTVNPAPTATTGNDAIICQGGNVTLGTSAVAGHTYLWAPATGLSSATIANPVASPTATTTYTLTETITATGCQASNTVKVTVGGAPGISVSACVGGSVSLSATATGTDVGYQWRKGEVNLTDGDNISGANAATLTISPVKLTDASTNYNVVLTGACSVGLVPLNIALVVFNTPTIITEPANQFPCVGSSAVFSVTAAGIGLSYQWRKGTVNLVNGGDISGATSARLTIAHVSASDVASNYNVVITGACSATTVASTYASLALCIPTGLAQANANKVVSIYPNPSKTSISIDIIDSSKIKNAELKLYDALGAVIVNTALTSMKTTINTGKFPTGIYFYKVMDNNKTIQSGKLIFQK